MDKPEPEPETELETGPEPDVGPHSRAADDVSQSDSPVASAGVMAAREEIEAETGELTSDHVQPDRLTPEVDEQRSRDLRHDS